MPFTGDTFSYTAGTEPGPAGSTIDSTKAAQRDTDVKNALNTTTSVGRGGTGATTVITAHDALVTKGSDIASAGTINLTTATGSYVNITGTTTVTAVTLAEGALRIARATGAFQLTAGASLVVNGSTSVNYTTTAGDLLFFAGDASSVVRVWTFSGGSLSDYLPLAGGTMTGVVGGFESTGLNDNATTTVMELDSSDNVLINGATSTTQFNVKSAGTTALFEGTGGSVFLQLKDFDDGTSVFLGADGGSFKVQTPGSSFSDKLTISSAGVSTFAATIITASYTVGTVPSAATAAGLIYVSNETGGAVPAFSDGTNWRRVTDRAVVS